MSTLTEPMTFATTIAVCRECGAEAQAIEARDGGGSRLRPCGHDAKLILKPNPKLED